MLIRFTEVNKSYFNGDKEISVLRGVSLEVKKGEFISIMGRSGSGKSTLLHLLGCLDLPNSGSYELNGVLLTSLDDKALSAIRNQEIGFIFQSFNLIPQLDILENVEVPLHYGEKPPSEGRERCLRLIEKVGLSERLHHRPAQLSGGEMQRVAIARALVNDPLLILADEPTGNLDSMTALEIMNLMVELNRQGKTIIMVTHDPLIAGYGQRVLHMQDGVLQC